MRLTSSTRRSLVATAAAVALVGGTLVAAAPAANAATFKITEFPLAANSFPYDIVAAPDGNLWFSPASKSLGRITTAGVITLFPGITGDAPGGLTVGPDNQVWFTEVGIAKIGSINTATGGVTEHTVDKAATSIASAGGYLWFAEQGTTRIGRFDPATTSLSYFTAGADGANDVSAGADGTTLWFTNCCAAQVSVMTMDGSVIHTYPTTGSTGDIAPGPNGSMWFVEATGGKTVGRIASDGTLTEWTIGRALSGVTQGADGAMYLSDAIISGGAIYRTTGDGTSTSYDIGLTQTSQPYRVALGSDGNIWWTEYQGSKIGRLVLTPTATAPGAVTITGATAGNATATVTWSAPASNGGSAITGYSVSTTPAGGTCVVSGLSATCSGLTNGQGYTVNVAAVNAVGTGPATASAAVTPKTVPSAPTTVAVTGSGTSATVTWQPPASTGGSEVTGYRVTATPGGATVDVPGTALTTTIPGLAAGTTYSFAVSALNVVGSGPAASTDAAGTSLVLKRSKASVTFGSSASLSGTLTTVTGGVLPGRSVQILAKAFGASTYTVVTTLTTSATGAYAVTVKPAKATSYYATYAGGPGLLGRTTSALSIGVASRVSIKLSATKTRVGATVYFSGLVSPKASGRVVYLQRLVAGKWSTVKSMKATAKSTYRFAWKPKDTKDYSFRVSIPTRPGYLAGRSVPKKLTVA